MSFIPNLLLLALLFISSQNHSDTTMMTDLSKEEIIRLYETHSGRKITSPDDFCVKKASSFQGVYSLGFFAHDRGCKGNEILVGTTIGELGKMMATALELNGWKDKNKQQELALNWTKEVILAWESPLSRSNEDFGLNSTHAFEAPSCIADGENWVVKIWVKGPVGMRPQANYYQLEIIFDPFGKVLSQNKINSFSVFY